MIWGKPPRPRCETGRTERTGGACPEGRPPAHAGKRHFHAGYLPSVEAGALAGAAVEESFDDLAGPAGPAAVLVA